MEIQIMFLSLCVLIVLSHIGELEEKGVVRALLKTKRIYPSQQMFSLAVKCNLIEVLGCINPA